jgi:RNA polymerase sigma-70 factor (ECF subfamily)
MNKGIRSERKAADGKELALLKCVQRLDREAFSDLYRLFHPRLYGYLLRMLPNAALIEEALDDVMLVVWKDARKFQGRSSVSTWVFGIAYRKALSAIRSESRYHAPLDRHFDETKLPTHVVQTDNWLDVAMAQLSADHRQVIELTYFGGFSYQEIAQIADCPVNTVKTRMYHAKRRLRVLLPKLATPTRERDRDHI